MFCEVAICNAFLELVLTKWCIVRHICNVRVNIDHRMNTISLPLCHHFFPMRILILVELPVPEQSLTLNEIVSADPVLHPESCDWDTVILEISIAFLDDIFTTL